MSGIVGILERGGQPVDHGLLRMLTHYLSFRGPDARETWVDGSVGFGHMLLRTTNESLAERQPASLEGRYTITADARIDCRAELLSQLSSAGRKVPKIASDPELILHAYAEWGEQCVERLRGDFAFAIWDARRKTLFCARDHFGVKPFYFAELGETFVFSNTLNCLRLHPDVSEELNDAAIADFLLFGMNCDLETTTYRDIRRLPPAHSLLVSATDIQLRRYWSLPTDGHIRYSRHEEYIEHFQELMRAAVADRLRTPRVGIMLSGGLDSSSIAATAAEIARETGGTTDLRAFTVTYDSLIPDRDGEYARRVAEFLRIPIRCLPADGLQLFERWEDNELSWPEPVDDPLFVGLFDQSRMIAAECRVALEGEGMDNLMIFEVVPYFQNLVRNGEWSEAAQQAVRYLAARPPIWPGIRRRLKALAGPGSAVWAFPRWIAPELATRLSLKERWLEFSVDRATPPHSNRPAAHASLLHPRWAHALELQDPGITQSTVEVRHPFLDVRVVEYVLALPPFPWTFQKSLLREAVAGHLPEDVRLRPKSMPLGDPVKEKLRRGEAARLGHAHWTEQIERYARPKAVPMPNGGWSLEEINSMLRPLCLNFWLQSERRVRYNQYAEAHSG